MPAPYKILVVDDEADLEPLMLQRMRRQIRSGQYAFVAFARNGVEALELLNRDQSIDMVVSDINMPEMNGLTLLNEIAKLDCGYVFRGSGGSNQGDIRQRKGVCGRCPSVG